MIPWQSPLVHHEAFIALVCNEICGLVPVDEVSRLMVEGDINSCTSTRRFQGALLLIQLSQIYRLVGESACFFYSKDITIYLESRRVRPSLSIGWILGYSILSPSTILLPICVLYARAKGAAATTRINSNANEPC